MQEKRFLDRVLQFMGIQEEVSQEEVAVTREEVAPAAPKNGIASAADAKKKGRLVSLPGANRSMTQVRVSVIHPASYEEVQHIADQLKDRQPVILSLEGLDKELSRRILDFVSGATYALDGSIHRIGEGIFFFAPVNVSIDAEMARGWREEEIFS